MIFRSNSKSVSIVNEYITTPAQFSVQNVNGMLTNSLTDNTFFPFLVDAELKYSGYVAELHASTMQLAEGNRQA